MILNDFHSRGQLRNGYNFYEELCQVIFDDLVNKRHEIKWHSRGREFDPSQLHQNQERGQAVCWTPFFSAGYRRRPSNSFCAQPHPYFRRRRGTDRCRSTPLHVPSDQGQVYRSLKSLVNSKRPSLTRAALLPSIQALIVSVFFD